MYEKQAPRPPPPPRTQSTFVHVMLACILLVICTFQCTEGQVNGMSSIVLTCMRKAPVPPQPPPRGPLPALTAVYVTSYVASGG